MLFQVRGIQTVRDAIFGNKMCLKYRTAANNFSMYVDSNVNTNM